MKTVPGHNSAICIIPARGGSRRIPLKNIREFEGKPMIAYAIENALSSDLFNEVRVSSDSEEILDIAVTYGAATHLRDRWLAEDAIGTQEVMQKVLIELGAKHQLACCLYPCTPLLRPQDLKNAAFMLTWERTNPATHYVATVGYPPLHDAGGFYFGKLEAFTSGHPLFQTTTRLYCLPPGRDCDINTLTDWQMAIDLYRRMEELNVHN